MSYDVEQEQDVLSRCLIDYGFFKRAISVVEEGTFSVELYRWAWRELRRVHDAHKELAGANLLATRAAEEFDADDLEYVGEVIGQLYEHECSAPLAALEQIRKFTKVTAARAAVEEAIEAIDTGDEDAAIAALQGGVRSARRASLLRAPTSLGDTTEDRLERYMSRAKDPHRVIKTPFPTLNTQAMPGGFPIGKVGNIEATTNIGKTSLITDFGHSAVVHSHSVVLHVTTEEEQTEVEARYDARITGIGRDKLATGGLSKGEIKQFRAKFKEIAHLKDRFRVQKVPRGHRVSVLPPMIDEIREIYPKSPILLIYDSPFHAIGPSTQYSDPRFSYKETIEYVDNMAKQPEMGLGKLAVWITWQSGRKWAGKVPTAEASGESYDINRTVDFGIGLREGENLKGGGKKIIEVWITRNRIGKLKKAVIYTEADLDYCKFTELSHGDYEELLGA